MATQVVLARLGAQNCCHILARLGSQNCCHSLARLGSQNCHILARHVHGSCSLARCEGVPVGLARHFKTCQYIARRNQETNSIIKRKLSTSRLLSVSDKYGHIRPDPVGEPLAQGLVKVGLVVSLGLYVGARISMSMVAFLEEYDIFVPDEDDDD